MDLQSIVDWRLCLGCGACAPLCPEKRISLVDFPTEGIRPVLGAGDCHDCVDCLAVCPAYENDRSEANTRQGVIKELLPYCGPVLEIWEAHAVDPEVRFMGSSGGLITALSLYCIEVKEMHGVLHTAADPSVPWKNKTRFSRSRIELLEATGSRYAPASVCDGLGQLENAPSPCLVVGQPSEITALRKSQVLRPKLNANVGLAISFFCAGSPSTQGTLDYLKKHGVVPEAVEAIRYRGLGWPGHFVVKLKGDPELIRLGTYAESWSFLQAYRPFSVHLSPDGTGEDADITCGDPWYRKIEPSEPGSSLVMIRTELGRRVFADAVNRGYVAAERLGIDEVLSSQRNLFEKRGAIWGRLLMLKLLGIPVPRLSGFSLFRNWLRLSFQDKARSVFGTARRVIRRRLYKPLQLGKEMEL